MALGKPYRPDRKSSSSYCSTATIIIFVALCLIGVWMMTSTSFVPVQTVDVVPETKTEIKEASGSSNPAFEDNPGDLPEDAIQVDSNTPNKDNKPPEVEEQTKESQNPIVETQEKESIKENKEDETGGGSDDSRGATENPDGDGDKQQPQIEEKVEEKPNESTGDGEDRETKAEPKVEEKFEQNPDGNQDQPDTENDGSATKVNSDESTKIGTELPAFEEKKKDATNESFPDAAQSEILKETNTQVGSWKTQGDESKNEKDANSKLVKDGSGKEETPGYSWKLCNATASFDYIPCLDNEDAIKHLKTTKHYEHRERHCPSPGPKCLVPLPEGYKKSIKWPKSRDKIWYFNVPHTKLAQVKGHQNWVKVSGEYLLFPGGGTQFKNGAQHYLDFIQDMAPGVAWGERTRVVLDVGCGVASFGGYLFDKDVLTMSFAPKDEHEAQVQFALERGIPAISAVMGTQRLPFPSMVFDVIHCARCRVPWHLEGGKLLLELNRLLRPGGFFVWSATPVYQKDEEDVGIWNAMSNLTQAMCWDLKKIKYDKVNQVGAAVYQKPSTNDCYENRKENAPSMCQDSDDPNASWYVPLQACMHKIPKDESARASKWPELWPARLENPPYWLSASRTGVYGKAIPEDFSDDYNHWKRVVTKSYLKGLGIDWSNVRNVMDMRAVYGGFAAALKDLQVWVMNVVPVDSPDTLPIIYERGLFGMYHDWCESFSTYPRTYDLLHSDHLFSSIKKCDLVTVMAEVDRILRPEGKLIVRDNVDTISKIESMAKSLNWEVRLTYSKDKEGLLCVQKTIWRPQD